MSDRIHRWKERRDYLRLLLDTPQHIVTRWGTTVKLHRSPQIRQKLLNKIARLDLKIAEEEAEERQDERS